MPAHEAAIDHTKKWLSSVIIAQGLCPFAKREYDSGRIHYAILDGEDVETQLTEIILECTALDRDPERETSLLIFPHALRGFEDYLDLLDLANTLLKTQSYEGIYQLASFHPDYQFADVPADDASHYTNRSPYPMIHILRETSVEAAVKLHPNPEGIPTRNIEHVRALGVAAMAGLLAACFE